MFGHLGYTNENLPQLGARMSDRVTMPALTAMFLCQMLRKGCYLTIGHGGGTSLFINKLMAGYRYKSPLAAIVVPGTLFTPVRTSYDTLACLGMSSGFGMAESDRYNVLCGIRRGESQWMNLETNVPLGEGYGDVILRIDEIKSLMVEVS